MKTVFHASTPEAVRVSVVKARNLLDDDTLELDSVAVVSDRGEAIAELHEESSLADDVTDLLAEGIRFAVCSNAVEHPAVSRLELLDGVEVVSSGVGELTRLQDAGHAYIRV
ncbi:DsrE family protein [Halorussus amylolyticus]|uniref:DsrE family protein n=1 Tax=Halorussus amylolyticus TaxID=1126242 RepID=UPI00138F2C85|nr:DsrE family protein [Halorussus amylolyticus]